MTIYKIILAHQAREKLSVSQYSLTGESNTGQLADAGWPVLFRLGAMSALHLHHAAEAHEGHSEDAGGDEGDGNALHRGGELGA